MYVCLCKGITESKLREVGRSCEGCPELLASALGLDDEECCRRCIRNIRGLAAMACERVAAAAPRPHPSAS